MLTISGYGIRDFTLEIVGVDPITHLQFINAVSDSSGDFNGEFATNIGLAACQIRHREAVATLNIYAKDANGTRIGGTHFSLNS